MNIKPGSIIKGPNWPEPVEVKHIEETANYFHIVGSTTKSRNHIDDLIPKDEISNYSIESVQEYFSAKPREVFLVLESIRYRFTVLVRSQAIQ